MTCTSIGARAGSNQIPFTPSCFHLPTSLILRCIVNKLSHVPRQKLNPQVSWAHGLLWLVRLPSSFNGLLEKLCPTYGHAICSHWWETQDVYYRADCLLCCRGAFSSRRTGSKGFVNSLILRLEVVLTVLVRVQLACG